MFSTGVKGDPGLW